MSVSTKNSRLALVRETTQGTPVEPSAAGEYVALQDGFSFDPAIEELENAELTGTIGQAKAIIGGETPAASLSHYLRHSGVEGQAPNFGLLLEAAFGDKEVAATEYNTVAASTAGTANARAVTKVDAGEGVNFERGQALLIKDQTNGYSIRPVYSVAGDDLSLGFNLGAAPGVGVNLGKAVLYKPGTAHPTISGWLYRGNSGAVELIAGLRVLELGLEASAGQFINMNVSLEGVEYFFNPVTIDASNNKIDFEEVAANELTATLASGTYKDPHDFAAQVKSALEAVGANTYTVTYSDSTGKFTIETSGGFLSFLWDTGTNAANTAAGILGYSDAADDTGATTYTSDNALTLTSPHTPDFDDENPLVAKANELMIGDFDDYAVASAQSLNVSLSNEKVDQLDITAASGKSGSVIVRRTGQVDIVAPLEAYDVDRFRRFREGDTTSLLWNFGRKSGGNWIPGQCGCLYIPSGVISAFRIGDSDGQATVELSIKPFVEDGLGEIYLNLL
jgi:hypothetical protein